MKHRIASKRLLLPQEIVMLSPGENDWWLESVGLCRALALVFSRPCVLGGDSLVKEGPRIEGSSADASISSAVGGDLPCNMTSFVGCDMEP